MWIAFLARNWKWLAIAGALIVAGLWLRSYGHRQCERCRAEVIAQYQVKLQEANARAEAAEKRAGEISRAKDAEWQKERNALQTRVDTLLLAQHSQPVRLCKPATSHSEVPPVSSSAGEPDGSAREPGPAMQAGEDIGPALLVYGGSCERYRAQLSALQSWISAQSN